MEERKHDPEKTSVIIQLLRWKYLQELQTRHQEDVRRVDACLVNLLQKHQRGELQDTFSPTTPWTEKYITDMVGKCILMETGICLAPRDVPAFMWEAGPWSGSLPPHPSLDTGKLKNKKRKQGVDGAPPVQAKKRRARKMKRKRSTRTIIQQLHECDLKDRKFFADTSWDAKVKQPDRNNLLDASAIKMLNDNDPSTIRSIVQMVQKCGLPNKDFNKMVMHFNKACKKDQSNLQ